MKKMRDTLLGVMAEILFSCGLIVAGLLISLLAMR